MSATTNSELFLKLIDQHKGILYKVANSYCQDEGHREDLIQEIILQLWKSYPKYNNEYKLSTWIYRIALNVSISYYRKERNRSRIKSDFKKTIISIEDPDVLLAQNNDLFYLKKFIEELKPIDKALILLYLEDKSYQDISEILGISPSNVGTKVNRIKNTLKIKFEKLKITSNE